MGIAQDNGQDSFFVEVGDDSRQRRGKPVSAGDGADGEGQRHLTGTFLTFLSCGGNGNLPPHPVSIPAWWGSSPWGTPRLTWASA